jgi:ribosomal protein L12E/L44/L45/RPP1/RPP2
LNGLPWAGFLAGAPTDAFDLIRDRQTRKAALAQRMRDLYEDMFAANTDVFRASDDDIKGLISRLTGKDAEIVQRITNTFKALAAQADFDAKPMAIQQKPRADLNQEETEDDESGAQERRIKDPRKSAREFHYNIQIHLPITTDVSVYNAIFKAVREHLDV